tara:strand:- start:3029 stop:3346 length:318 start_codon:yes stop_codon:yes gene_type:complete
MKFKTVIENTIVRMWKNDMHLSIDSIEEEVYGFSKYLESERSQLEKEWNRFYDTAECLPTSQEQSAYILADYAFTNGLSSNQVQIVMNCIDEKLDLEDPGMKQNA